MGKLLALIGGLGSGWLYAGIAAVALAIGGTGAWTARGVLADLDFNKLVATQAAQTSEQATRRADLEAQHRLREKELQDAADLSNRARDDALLAADSMASALRRSNDGVRKRLAPALAQLACGPGEPAGAAPTAGAAQLADAVADGLQLQVELVRVAVAAQVDAAGVRASYERARAERGAP
jgi:hypothetical protein